LNNILSKVLKINIDSIKNNCLILKLNMIFLINFYNYY